MPLLSMVAGFRGTGRAAIAGMAVLCGTSRTLQTLRNFLEFCVCVCMCVRDRVCARVCVFVCVCTYVQLLNVL